MNVLQYTVLLGVADGTNNGVVLASRRRWPVVSAI